MDCPSSLRVYRLQREREVPVLVNVLLVQLLLAFRTVPRIIGNGLQRRVYAVQMMLALAVVANQQQRSDVLVMASLPSRERSHEATWQPQKGQ